MNWIKELGDGVIVCSSTRLSAPKDCSKKVKALVDAINEHTRKGRVVFLPGKRATPAKSRWAIAYNINLAPGDLVRFL